MALMPDAKRLKSKAETKLVDAVKEATRGNDDPHVAYWSGYLAAIADLEVG